MHLKQNKSSKVYDSSLTFQENLLEGPFFTDPIPQRIIPPHSEWKTLFGYDVMTPIGIPACPFVVNARGLKLAIDLGYDVITWKTIRSNATQARPYPQVSLLKNQPIIDFDAPMITTHRTPQSADELAFSVSIGNASHELAWVQEEMHKGRACIQPGQLFISSIYGVGDTQREIIDDFVFLACAVKDAGAHAVEANLSCPNVGGVLYKNEELVGAICSAIVRAIGDTPLTIKLGMFDSFEHMQIVLLAAARAGVRGITAINAIGMNIVDEQGKEFYPGRPHAGVCGVPVRPHALQFIADARKISNVHGLQFTILGCGGITQPEHFDLFFHAGADAALSAAGAMHYPYLAHDYATRLATVSIQYEKQL